VTRVCCGCSKEKDLEEFPRSKNRKFGRGYRCLPCQRIMNRAYYNKNKERENIRCTTYKKENYDKVREQANDKRKNNVDEYRKKGRERYTTNPDRYRQKSSKYRKNNPGAVNFLTSSRRVAKLKATPSWLTDFDKSYIKNIYIQSATISRIDEQLYHVDHIIPLQGKGVCGLHVPWNLQILTATENSKKGNKYE